MQITINPTKDKSVLIERAFEKATKLMLLMPRLNTDFSEMLHNVICLGILSKIQRNEPLTEYQQNYWDRLYEVHCERMAILEKEGCSAVWYRTGNEELIQTTMLEQ